MNAKSTTSKQPGLLVIVPCGFKKIWSKFPDKGPTLAQDVYTGSPFAVNRAFAEKFGETWMILSAKYGLIDPAFVISRDYNVTLKDRRTDPVSTDYLRDQVMSANLQRFSKVIALGGKEYRLAVQQAFEGLSTQLYFPFSGLPIGIMMQRTKQATAENDPFGKSATGVPERLTDGTSNKSMRIKTMADRVGFQTADICRELHWWLAELPSVGFPYSEEALPMNGIYVLFEKGEQAHDTNRIVRIGTHTGNNQLPKRLKQHFLLENKDRSIFRKNIGRCLLSRDNDMFLEAWELDLTTRAARDKHSEAIDTERQRQVEHQVSQYIKLNFSFVLLEVPDKERRLELESKITSCISLCPQCGPSRQWLGLNSPKPKIRQSGLWQVNELHKTPLTAQELEQLKDGAVASCATC